MKYHISSPLSLDECIQRLQAANCRNSPRFPVDFSRPLSGQVERSGVSLRLTYGWKNPLAPYFQGSFHPGIFGSTVLEGEFKVLTAPKIYMAIWAAFILLGVLVTTLSSVIVLGGILLIYGEVLVSAMGNELPAIIATALVSLLCLPPSMLFMVITIPAFLFIIRRADPPVLLNLLKNLLEAEIHNLP